MQESRIGSVVDKVRELKTQAKNRRDSKRYERAIQKAEEAIELARSELEHTSLPAYRTQLASELSDLYGLVGGVERRQALDASDPKERQHHFQSSVHAYDQGYAVESDTRFGLIDSYCQVNRLLARAFLNPGVLSSPPEPAAADGLDVRQELEAAAAQIEGQLVAERRDDYWALADVAIIDVALQKRDPIAAFERFNFLLPPEFAYRSAIETLRGFVAIGIGDSSGVRRAIDHLERLSQRHFSAG